MTDVRYQVPGVPHGPAAGLTAFTPAFIRHAASGAQSYKYAVTGWPGTRGVPMTAMQDTYMSPDVGDKTITGTSQSSDSPDAIWPNKYFQGYAVELPGGYDNTAVAVYDPTRPGLTSLLPVPAQDWRGLYQDQSARLSRRAVLQRAKSLPWFPRIWANREGTFNG
jgi:hypothetical protein